MSEQTIAITAMSGWKFNWILGNTVSFIKVAPNALGKAYVPSKIQRTVPLTPAVKTYTANFFITSLVS